MVSLKFNLPLDVDADIVREVMMEAMQGQEGVLDKPAPSVTLEAFNEVILTFSASCYVASPRQVSGMRSELMFQMLGALRRRDIKPRSVPPQQGASANVPVGQVVPVPPATT